MPIANAVKNCFIAGIFTLASGLSLAATPTPLELNNAPNYTRIPFDARNHAPIKDAAASVECRADVVKLCRGIEPGRRRVGTCLDENKALISSAQCEKTVVEAEIAYDKAWPCHTDAKRLCQNVLPGEGRLGNCLSAHFNELGAQCVSYRSKSAKEFEQNPSNVSRLQSSGAAPVWNESLL